MVGCRWNALLKNQMTFFNFCRVCLHLRISSLRSSLRVMRFGNLMIRNVTWTSPVLAPRGGSVYNQSLILRGNTSLNLAAIYILIQNEFLNVRFTVFVHVKWFLWNNNNGLKFLMYFKMFRCNASLEKKKKWLRVGKQ